MSRLVGSSIPCATSMPYGPRWPLFHGITSVALNGLDFQCMYWCIHNQTNIYITTFIIYNTCQCIYIYIYLENRLASKFWCWSSETVFYLNAAGISGMRRSLGNRHHFWFWCWNAPFLPIVFARAKFPLRRFCVFAPCFLHCAVLADLRLIFLQFGNAPKILGTSLRTAHSL